jgi:TonB family protein
MNPRTAIVAICLGLLTVGSSLAKPAASPVKLFVFHGKVQSVDPGARTFTITSDLGSSVFDVTKETRIFRHPNSMRSREITLDNIKVGEAAEVFVGGGSTQRATAVLVKLEYDSRNATIPSLFAAKTVRGGNVSGPDLAKLVTYMPNLGAFTTSIDYGAARQGVFLLSVRPDGTVSKVEVLSSIGYGELDEKTKSWLMKWRFQPNSVVEVRVPSSFVSSWPY